MAEHSSPPDLFDIHQESSAFSNDDFEKLDAPMDSGLGFDRDEVAAAAGAYEPSQDAEVSTTTDADISGEEEAEEDLYNVGASEAEAHADPLISFGDDSHEVPAQPSAPVPEYSQNEPLESLLSFDDFVQSESVKQPIPSSTTPESILSFNNPVPPQPDAFNETEKSEPLKEERKQASSSDQSQSAVDVTKGSSWLKGVDPRVIDLIYWRDVKKTGIVFGAMLVVLLSLAIFSLVSVVAYLSLAALTVTFSFTIYKKVMGAVQKSNEGHPFKQLIERDISLKEEKLKCVIQSCLKHVNIALCELRRLFLIEDMVDSIKFGLLLWVLTYIGAWFNGMTLVILEVILLFTMPKVYETYQTQIDSYIGLAKSHVDNVLKIVQSKLPFLKKKDKTQ